MQTNQSKCFPLPIRSLPLLAGMTMLLATSATARAALPANPGLGEQWALSNTGQFQGTPGDDIDISQAWELEPGGNASVLVGFVDSGVSFDQPSLAHANLFTQGAGSCGGALYGCSFVGAGGTPSDEAGHGTATAGEVFAGWNEGPYAGIAPASTLIVAKVLGSSAAGSTAAEAAGLRYVAERGARVVNVSIAGSQSSAVHEAIASHPETLFVAAAGNSSANDDGAGASYPCADPSPNVICVAASDPDDRLASFSNYGASTVDLAAPGTNIATLTLEGASDAFNGTSYAAPLVTGTAALAFALRPRASAAQVKQAILESVDARQELGAKTLAGGRLNAYRALLDLSAMLPGAPPASTSAPVLAGGASVGETVSATTGTWSGSPSSTTVAWERCDAAGGHCQLIAGAAGASYRLTAADLGSSVRAQVTASGSAGAEIAFSTPSATIAAQASPGSGADSGSGSGSEQAGARAIETSGEAATAPVAGTGATPAPGGAASGPAGAALQLARSHAQASGSVLRSQVRMLAHGVLSIRLETQARHGLRVCVVLSTAAGRARQTTAVLLVPGRSYELRLRSRLTVAGARRAVLEISAGNVSVRRLVTFV